MMLREDQRWITDSANPDARRLGGAAVPFHIYWGGRNPAAANSPVLLVQPDPSRRLHGFWKTPGFLDAGSQSRYSARS